MKWTAENLFTHSHDNNTKSMHAAELHETPWNCAAAGVLKDHCCKKSHLLINRPLQLYFILIIACMLSSFRVRSSYVAKKLMVPKPAGCAHAPARSHHTAIQHIYIYTIQHHTTSHTYMHIYIDN